MRRLSSGEIPTFDDPGGADPELIPGGGRFGRMSRAERREALEDIVVAQFKDMLFMDDGDELSLDLGFYDMGLTSLRLVEVRQRIESELVADLDPTVLFRFPTIEDLVEHLVGLFGPQTADRGDRS